MFFPFSQDVPINQDTIDACPVFVNNEQNNEEELGAVRLFSDDVSWIPLNHTQPSSSAFELKSQLLRSMDRASPTLINLFLDNEKEQNPDYLDPLFDCIIDIEAEYNFAQNDDEVCAGTDSTEQFIQYMNMLYKQINKSDFERAEQFIARKFINAGSLLLLQWLEPNISSQELKDDLKRIIIDLETDCNMGWECNIDEEYIQTQQQLIAKQLTEQNSLFKYENLLRYLSHHVGEGKEFHLILQPNEVYKSVRQRGENCKLAALAHAIEHIAVRTNSSFPHLYKEGNKGLISLRQLAKQHGSKIGEMYSINSLLKTCSSAGFQSKWSTHDNEEDYINQLKNYLACNHVPIIFFDVDITVSEHHGFPLIDGDGSNEHSATVIAFYIDKYDRTHFMVEHWSQVFDFDGMELARSTNRLQERRSPETFYKIFNTTQQNTAWVLKKNIGPNKIQLDNPARIASPIMDDEKPLKNTIMVVTEPHQERNLFFSRPISKKTGDPNPEFNHPGAFLDV